MVAIWPVFWGLIVWLRITQPDLLSAGVTGVLFVIPAFIGLVAYPEILAGPLHLVPT